MQIHLKSKVLSLLVILFALSSCNTARQVTYLNHATQLGAQPVTQVYDVKIQQDDVLSIFVFCQDPLLAAPFNMELAQQQLLSGNASTNNNTRLQEENKKGFIVDSSGCIDYPVFGRMRVAGLTRLQLADSIKGLLISNGYINDPVVNVRLLNFKVTVLGEVASPGQIAVKSDRITLFEAIAQAGDLSIYGRRNNVRLIREADGVRQVHTFSLQDSALLQSDFYYLQQNDLVYVEPNNSKAYQGRFSTFWSFFLSAVSFVSTIGLYFTR